MFYFDKSCEQSCLIQSETKRILSLVRKIFSRKLGMKVLDQYPRCVLYSNYSGLHIELEEQCCSHCPSMSFEYRLMCCIFCIVLGFLISMGSTFRLMKLLAGNPYPFAVLYSIGNILGISSTCFLFGPVAQFKKMFAPTRYFFPPPHFAIFDGIVFLGLSRPFVTCFSCF